MTPPITIPAATLILFRERAGADPELLMIERGGGMTFAAGAMVFPGGRVDPGDLAMAGDGGEDAAARIAAIRETIEEVGIAVGIDPPPDAPTIARLRDALVAGGDFATLLRDGGMRLDPAVLTPFARWRPNMGEKRNFDTMFFLAEAPCGAVAEPDGGESVHAIWTTARALRAEADAGRYRVIFPTRRNLERLARLASLAMAREHAASLPVRAITPWIERRDGRDWLCIPDDCGYPVTAEPLDTAVRG